MRLVKASLLYFALVFGAGFVLGTIRTLWMVPRFGVRAAELMEMPVMLVVTIVAARWTVRRFVLPAVASVRLAVGSLALLYMLVAEFGLVSWIRKMSIREYVATRDPVSGTAYYLLLIVFAVMPLVISKK